MSKTKIKKFKDPKSPSDFKKATQNWHPMFAQRSVEAETSTHNPQIPRTPHQV